MQLPFVSLPFLFVVVVLNPFAANAERALIDRATTRRAVNASIMMMRFIFSVSFPDIHLTPMKPKLR